MARVINVQDLTMRIGARQLVAHAGFRVDKGMRIGLVGRNGAGKTTMTKLLAATSVAQGAGRAVNDADERHGLEAVEHEGTITCTSSVGYQSHHIHQPTPPPAHSGRVRTMSSGMHRASSS